VSSSICRDAHPEVSGGRVRSFTGNYSDYRKARLVERSRTSGARRDVERERKAAAEKARAARAAPAKKEKAKNPWSPPGRGHDQAPRPSTAQLLASLGEERVYKDATLAKETQLRLAEIERDLEQKNAEWKR
jgi:ATPase subunit of ABC transporter with duplicated ATPase domains